MNQEPPVQSQKKTRFFGVIIQATITGLLCGLIAAAIEVAVLALTGNSIQLKQVLTDAVLLDCLAITGLTIIGAVIAWFFGRRDSRPALTLGLAMIVAILGISVYQEVVLYKYNVSPNSIWRIVFIVAVPLLSLGLGYALAGKLGSFRPAWATPGVAQSRRLFLTWIGGALVAMLAAGFAADRINKATRAAAILPPAPSGKGPNILLITIDTWRGDYLGADGRVEIQTPTLDALAASGTRFTRVFANQPQTNPNHATILTGLSPAKHHVRAHMVDLLDPSIPTIATVLQNQGYNTAAFYSWTSLEPAFCGFQRGFKVYQENTVNRPTILQQQQGQEAAAFYRRASEHLALGELAESVLQRREEVQTEIDGRADVTTDAVLKWLEANNQSDKPWFMWIHYFDPHYPYSPPAPYDTQYDPNYRGPVDGSLTSISKFISKEYNSPADLNHLKSLYKGEVSFTDSQLNRLFSWLDENQVRQNTVLAVTGDHGEAFGEFGQWEHGLDVHTAAVRVPLILSYPGVVPAKRVVESNVGSMDIMPTLLDLAKIPLPDGVEGTSVRPLFNAEDPNRTTYSQVANDTQMSITQGQWMLIRNMVTGQKELYDIHNDLYLSNDLAGTYPDVAAQLEQQLGKWVAAHAKH